jgi:hypothetical protein
MESWHTKETLDLICSNDDLIQFFLAAIQLSTDAMTESFHELLVLELVKDCKIYTMTLRNLVLSSKNLGQTGHRNSKQSILKLLFCIINHLDKALQNRVTMACLHNALLEACLLAELLINYASGEGVSSSLGLKIDTRYARFTMGM